MSDDKQRETPELEGWYHIVAGLVSGVRAVGRACVAE
jgi:hypothetical protein